ncbi:hypothetical protein QBC46DRAFT_242900, partial [Diplogelasinospora grovesii]
LSLQTSDVLIDSGANGYIFVNTAFARRMKKSLHVDEVRVKGRRIGGYNGKEIQQIDTLVKADLIIQGRTVKDEWMMVLDMSHDVIIGRKWFDYHDVWVDAGRRRLLFPEEWPQDPEWWKTITVDDSPHMRDPKYQQDVVRREIEMDKEDQQRRAGRQQITKRIKELELRLKAEAEVDARRQADLEKAKRNPHGSITLLPKLISATGATPEYGTTTLYEIDQLIDRRHITSVGAISTDEAALQQRAKEVVPAEYHEYLPPHRPSDHRIQ